MATLNNINTIFTLASENGIVTQNFVFYMGETQFSPVKKGDRVFPDKERPAVIRFCGPDRLKYTQLFENDGYSMLVNPWTFWSVEDHEFKNPAALSFIEKWQKQRRGYYSVKFGDVYHITKNYIGDFEVPYGGIEPSMFVAGDIVIPKYRLVVDSLPTESMWVTDFSTDSHYREHIKIMSGNAGEPMIVFVR